MVSACRALALAADPVTHYCIVDASLTPGQQAAQLIHAAGESGPAEPGTYAVALTATPEQLDRLRRDLFEAGVRFAPVCEADPPWYGALLAIGILPRALDSVRTPLLAFGHGSRHYLPPIH